MPKLGFSKLPQREEEICLRFRLAREDYGLTQEEMAEYLDSTRDRLASYEYARAPLRYGFAVKFCSAFPINYRWLAEGLEPREPRIDVDIPAEIQARLSPLTLFSEVYDSVLKPLVETRLYQLADTLECGLDELGTLVTQFRSGWIPTDRAPHRDHVAFALQAMIWLDFQILPDGLVDDYKALLKLASENFMNAFCLKQRRRLKGYGHDGETAVLQNIPRPVKPEGVSEEASLLNALRRRLVAATSERGRKASLAQLFKVSPSSVTEWLSGASAPSAEHTLRLLKWVEAEEAKQKAPAVQRTRPERRPKKGNSSEKKPPSGAASR